MTLPSKLPWLPWILAVFLRVSLGSVVFSGKPCYTDICSTEEFCDDGVRHCRLCNDIRYNCMETSLPAECRSLCVGYLTNKGVESIIQRNKVADCPDLGPLEHGNYKNVSNYRHGTTVTFMCDEGYRLVGMNKSTCGDFKTWSTPVPVCEDDESSDTNYTLQNVAIIIAVVEFIVIAGLIGFCCYKRYTNSCQYTPVNTGNDSYYTHSNSNHDNIHIAEMVLDVNDPNRSKNDSPKPPKHINNGRSNTYKKPVEETGRTTQGYQEVDKEGPSELVPNISSKCVPIADFGYPICCTGGQNQDGGVGEGLTPTAPLLVNDAPGAEIGSIRSHIAPTALVETLGDSQMPTLFTDTSRSTSEFEENQQLTSFVSDAQKGSGASTDVDNYSA